MGRNTGSGVRTMCEEKLKVESVLIDLNVGPRDYESVIVCAEKNAPTTYGRLLLCFGDVLNILVTRVVRLLQVRCTGESCESQLWLTRALKVLLSICKDEVCVQRAGQLGLHRSLIKLLMEALGGDNIDLLAMELLDVCGATCIKNELSFPIKQVPIEPEQVDIHKIIATSGPLQYEVLLRLAADTVEMGDKANYDVGYRLWGAAVVLCKQVFCNEPEILRNKSVLEIGAGIGILGLFASHPLIQAKSVKITDFNLGVIRHLQYNIQLNHSWWGKTHKEIRGFCSSSKLDWDQEIVDEEKHDVILGSDLICQESDAFNVLKVMDKLLAPSGTVLITLGSSESRYGVSCFEELLEDSAEWVSETLVCEASEGVLGGGQGSNLFVGQAKSYTTFRVQRRFKE